MKRYKTHRYDPFSKKSRTSEWREKKKQQQQQDLETKKGYSFVGNETGAGSSNVFPSKENSTPAIDFIQDPIPSDNLVGASNEADEFLLECDFSGTETAHGSDNTFSSMGNSTPAVDFNHDPFASTVDLDNFPNPFHSLRNYDQVVTNSERSNKTDADYYSPEQLCKCTKVTISELLIMNLAVGLRHKLSWAAQVDYLKMFNAIYGEDKLGASKYLYLKAIEQGKSDITYHLFCPECEMYIGKRDDFPAALFCKCGKEVRTKDPNSFFLSIDIQSQVKTLLEDPYIANLILTYRFSRKKINADNLEDIYDGDVYKTHFDNNGILSNPYNFSYTFSTDGAAMGKSSKKTIWPVYMVLNELPPAERKKYVILAGIYVGVKDPEQTAILQPFVDQANNLSTTGITWVHNDKNVVSRLIPICAVTDSVARWQLLNMSSFHAYYGCTFCYQKSQHFREGQRYVIPEEKAEERTSKSTKDDMKEAYQRMDLPAKQQGYKGVKGPSALMNMLYFDLIIGFVVDYMHAILAGVIRFHTDLLLCPSRKKFWLGVGDEIGIDHVISTIDNRILQIKPPTSITRHPRSLKDRSIWKCNEWRSWLLFYCIPCLKGLLKNEYLEHIAMLSKATHLLIQQSISLEDANTAGKLLLSYVFYFQEYFHKENMVYNVHLLSHISKGVRNFGPLWTHNSFLYEDCNRQLLELQQSPFSVALQITRKFLTYTAFPLLLNRMAKNENVFEYCKRIFGKNLKNICRCNDVVLLGNGSPYSLLPEEQVIFIRNGLCPTQLGLSFEKMVIKSARFTVESYSSKKKNDDSIIYLKNGRIFQIQKIIKCKEVIILGVELLVMPQFIKTVNTIPSNVVKVRNFGNLEAIKSNDIRCHGVLIRYSSADVFVCDVPYGCFED